MPQHIDKYTDTDALQTLAQLVKAELPDDVQEVQTAYHEVSIIAQPASVVSVLKFLRDHPDCQFKQLMDLCSVDYLDFPGHKNPRFAVVYHLLSLTKNMRVRVKVFVGEGDAVPTATGLFSSANWYERETFDMYGILFEKHPDLRRILTDYGFTGHPLRKDFPLHGEVEVYYDEDEKRVAYKPVDLPQETRYLDAESPWRGITGNAYLAEEHKPRTDTFDANEFKENA